MDTFDVHPVTILRHRLAPATAVAVAILAAVIAPRSAHAIDYTWSSDTTGGLWSGTANWTPNSGANGPTTADTVLLDTTASGTTRTVTITSAANSAISSLTLTQTNSGTNTLEIGRSLFTVTNAVALGASGDGTARIFLNPQTGTSNVATSFTGGLTVNSGGLLSLGAFNASGSGANVVASITGNVTVSGGSLILEAYNRQGTNTASQQNLITGSLSMTSGTLVINNASAGSGGSLNDRRLGTTGNLSITGGVVQTGASLTGGFSTQGVTNTFKPDSLTGGNAFFILLQGTAANANQSLTSNQIIPTLVPRATGIKTYTSEISGTNLGTLQIGDENNLTPGSRTTFRLGSNLTLQSGRALPSASGNSQQESGRVDLGIDTNGYTLDISGTYGTWTPNFAGTSVTFAVWDLSGSGTMITNGYNFSNVGTNGAVNVGAGLTLVSRSGTNGVNNLGSGTGTINATSTFRYSGTATVANPSTLTRAGGSIGNLEVTSGALTLVTLSGSAANLAVSGGLLNLGTNSRSVAAATFTGGTVSSGTLTTYSGGYTGGAAAGATATVSAILSGTAGLVHSGSGALVLSGANVYSGGSMLSAGTVRLGVDNVGTVGAITSGALGTGTLTFASGGISSDSTTARTILNSVVFTGDAGLGDATNSGVLTFAATADLGSAVRTLTVASPVAFDGALGGTGGLAKAGAATLTLTASNDYSGGTTITAGTLALGNGGASGSIAGDVTNDGTLSFNRSDAVTFGGAIGGTGAVRQEGPGKLTLSASNAYQGGMTVVGTGTLAITNLSALGTGTLTLRTSRNDTLNVFEVGTSGTVSNPIVIDMATSGRNNIEVAAGNAAVLDGPISIVGNAARTQVFYSDGTGFEIRGGITGTSFSSGLSFRGDGATGVISGTVNVPSAQVEVNGVNQANWRVTSTGNTWAVTQIGATGSFIVGANDALATGARVFWFQTPTGGVDLNGFNQTVAGLDSGTTAAGTGRVTNNSASGDSTLTLASGTANYEFRGPITDGTNGRKLALAVNFPGRTQTLSGTNSYSGGTTLTAGTIGLGNTSALGTGTLTFAGASTLQSALATGTFTNAIAISTGVTGTIDTNGNTATFSGPIAGPGGIAKTGSGTLVLSASNTMGSGTLTFGTSPSTADLGSITLANAKALGDYSAVSLAQNGVGVSGLNLTGGITTAYDLLSAGRSNAGTTGYILRSLSGSNAWNGNISINNTGGSYGFGADAGATLVLGGTISTTVSTSARNFVVSGSGTTIVAGRLVGTSSTNTFAVLKGDSGTLVLSSSNAYQGNTTLNEGVITFGNANAFGTGTVVVSNTGGVLRADVNAATVANAMTLNVTGTLDTQANTTTLSGTIGGAGSFVKAGTGTLVLTASNTYSGGTTINAGTLQIGNDGAAGWIQGNVENGGTLIFRRSDNVTFSGTISGTGGLTKQGAGTVTLTAANTFTGNVTVGNAANSPNYALRLQNSEALGPASAVKSVTVTGNNQTTSVLELAGDIAVDVNKTLLTSGHNYFNASSSNQGTPVFLRNVSGSNAWLGNVVMNAGGGGYAIESLAGTLVLGTEGTTSVIKQEVDASTRTINFTGAGNTVVNSRFTSGTTAGALTGFSMLGTGTLTIARTDNEFAFVPSLSVGTTRIASLANSSVASSLGTGASFNVGGTLEHIGGVNSSSNRGIGLLGATPTIVASGTGTLALTATGAITYQDPTSVLAYTYSSGATTLVARDAAGILPGFTITGTGIAPGTTITAVNYDTRVITLSQATTAGATSVSLTLGGQTDVPRTFVLGGTNAGANVFAARLVDKAAGTAPLSVSKTGAGAWAITGSNGYTGATAVEAGTLRIGNGATAGSIGTTSGISVAAGALLAFNRTDAYGGFFDRLISGSGDVRVESGFLDLTAANTYTGTTRVLAGGTLAVNGSLANAALFVDAGATLMGSGTILGDTTIQGSHMPGNSPDIETFTNLTYSGLAPSVTWELWGNTESNSPVAYDQVVVTGNLLFSDPTQLNLLFTGSGSGVNWTNSFWDSDRQWVLYDVTGTTTGVLNLSLVVQNWADSAGNLFGTVRGDATFTIVKDTESEDVLLVYAAVPEPGAIALAAAGLGAAAAVWEFRRRRSRKGSKA